MDCKWECETFSYFFGILQEVIVMTILNFLTFCVYIQLLNIYVDKKEENCMRDERRKSHQLWERFVSFVIIANFLRNFLLLLQVWRHWVIYGHESFIEWIFTWPAQLSRKGLLVNFITQKKKFFRPLIVTKFS